MSETNNTDTTQSAKYDPRPVLRYAHEQAKKRGVFFVLVQGKEPAATFRALRLRPGVGSSFWEVQADGRVLFWLWNAYTQEHEQKEEDAGSLWGVWPPLEDTAHVGVVVRTSETDTHDEPAPPVFLQEDDGDPE